MNSSSRTDEAATTFKGSINPKYGQFATTFVISVVNHSKTLSKPQKEDPKS